MAEVILSDQVKRLDWRSRNAQFAGQGPHEVIAEVLQKVATLILLVTP